MQYFDGQLWLSAQGIVNYRLLKKVDGSHQKLFSNKKMATMTLLGKC